MAGRLSSYTKREGASADSGSLLAGVEYRYENGKDRLTENRVTLPHRGSTSTTVTNKTNYVYGSGAEEKDRIHLPILAVYFLLNLDELIKLPAVYRHYRQYKWVKNLTTNQQ